MTQRPIKFRAWDRESKEMIDDAFGMANYGYGDGSLVVDERAQRGNELDWMSWNEMYEIIGNIHENPDLLI